MELVADVALPSVVLGPEDFWALSWFARIRAAVAMVFGVLNFEILEGGGEASPDNSVEDRARGNGCGFGLSD